LPTLTHCNHRVLPTGNETLHQGGGLASFFCQSWCEYCGSIRRWRQRSKLSGEQVYQCAVGSLAIETPGPGFHFLLSVIQVKQRVFAQTLLPKTYMETRNDDPVHGLPQRIESKSTPSSSAHQRGGPTRGRAPATKAGASREIHPNSLGPLHQATTPSETYRYGWQVTAPE
jgi:hypothetical protein